MANVGYATLQIIPSAKGFAKALKDEVVPATEQGGKEAGEKGGKAAGASFIGAMKPVLATMAVFATGQFLKGSIHAASEFQDGMTAIAEVAGKDVRDAVAAFGDTAAKAFGISKTAIHEAGLQLANFGQAAGLAGDDLAKFTIEGLSRAGDLASMFGGTVTEATYAMGAALRGEYEPMRRYGVLIDENTLKAKAFEMGLYSGKGVLDQQAKTLSAYAVIMEQSSKAAGDFARNSDSWANQQRTLTATVENLKIALGSALLPILERLGPIAMAAFDWVGNNAAWLVPLTTGLIGAGVAIKGVTMAINAYKAVATAVRAITAAWTASQWALNASMYANPIGLIILAIVALIAAIVLVIKYHEEIGAFFSKVWQGIKDIASAVADWFKNEFTKPFKAIGEWFAGPFASFFTETIPNAFRAVVDWFAALPGRIWDFISSIPGLMADGLLQLAAITGEGLGRLVRFFLDLPGTIWEILTNLWNKAVEIVTAGANAAVEWAVNFVTRTVETIKALPGRIWDLITSLWNRAVELVKAGVAAAIDHFNSMRAKAIEIVSNAVSKIIDFFTKLPGRAYDLLRSLPQKVWDAIVGAVSKANQLGRDIMQGLLNGLKSMWGKVTGFFGDLVDNFVGGFKKGLGIASPSKVFDAFGRWTMLGYERGIKRTADRAIKAVRSVSAAIADVPFTPPGGVAGQLAAASASTRTLNYYAAPGSSLGSEEDLFAAASRARMVW